MSQRHNTTPSRDITLSLSLTLTLILLLPLHDIYDPISACKRILSGRQIDELLRSGDDSLASVIEDVVVCYRTSPRHKLYIVRALQSRGQIVAMTGDGRFNRYTTSLIYPVIQFLYNPQPTLVILIHPLTHPLSHPLTHSHSRIMAPLTRPLTHSHSHIQASTMLLLSRRPTLASRWGQALMSLKKLLPW